jgi:hypothetical protein
MEWVIYYRHKLVGDPTLTKMTFSTEDAALKRWDEIHDHPNFMPHSMKKEEIVQFGSHYDGSKG